MAHFPLAKRRAFLYKVFRRAEVAQLVEQGTENPRVGSSILSLGTIFRARNVVPGFFFFRRERTGTHFRSPPGGTAGTTLPPQKVEFSPERLCPPAPELKNSSETHARPNLPPAERRKTATPARTSPLNARLSRTALHASYGVMAAPGAPSPLRRARSCRNPAPWSAAPASAVFQLSPALRAGRAPPAALGESRRPSALRPAPLPSFHTLVARAFRRALFPRFFPPCAIPSALVTPFPLRCTPPPRAAPRFRRAPPTRRREAATAKAAAASIRQKGRKE